MNNNKSMEHIDNAVDKIRDIFQKISDRIENMKPETKIPATLLAEEIGKIYGMTGPQLYPHMLYLIKGYPGIEVRRGAHGGIFKLAATNEAPHILPITETETLKENVQDFLSEVEDKTLPIINT